MRKAIFFVFAVSFCLLLVFCGRSNYPKPLVVLINATPAQHRFLRDEVLGGFEKLYNSKINLINYETDEELLALLSQDSMLPQITLVSVPFELTKTLALAQRITPFDDIVAEQILRFDAEIYHENFLNIGKINERFYYFPHKVEVPVLFYMKSKIGNAIDKFPRYKERINRVLKRENGFGLPKAYVLEENPNEWDFYDIFVIGYILANEEYGGKKKGRILSRDALTISKNGGKFVDYAAALGASIEDLKNLTGKEMEEMRKWEKIFKKYNIFCKRTYMPDITPHEKYQAIRNGEVFMAYFLQKDCFSVLEGTDESRMRSYISDVSDIGIALIPSAVSFSIDENGYLKNVGRRVSTISGFSWGIPQNAKNKELAYLLIQYLNNRNQNTKETVRFGSIPVREDVLMNLRNIFDEKWLGEGYAAALIQIANFFNNKGEK